jgi:hypothetical protein
VPDTQHTFPTHLPLLDACAFRSTSLRCCLPPPPCHHTLIGLHARTHAPALPPDARPRARPLPRPPPLLRPPHYHSVEARGHAHPPPWQLCLVEQLAAVYAASTPSPTFSHTTTIGKQGDVPTCHSDSSACLTSLPQCLLLSAVLALTINFSGTCSSNSSSRDGPSQLCGGQHNDYQVHTPPPLLLWAGLCFCYHLHNAPTANNRQ